MPSVVVRDGTGGCREQFLFCLNGWADLPFFAKGLEVVPDEFRVTAWIPPSPADAVRTHSVERFVDEEVAHLADTAEITVAGYSHGGIVALGAARDLARRTGAVVRLAIVECCPPHLFDDLPLDFEFFRSAPFSAPGSGPLVDRLRECQRSLHGRDVQEHDIRTAIDLVETGMDEVMRMAVAAADAAGLPTDGLDRGALCEKLTEWLVYLLLLRGLDEGPFDGPTRYIQSREGRDGYRRLCGEDDGEVVAWRKWTPDLTRYRIGERHWGLLNEDRMYETVFRLAAR